MLKLKAGASSVRVPLGADCFPNAECAAPHDDVFVRALVLESDRRFVLLSADMPSMFPDDLRYCQEMIAQKSGAEPPYVWVGVSHSFSAPHTWPVDSDNGESIHLPSIFREKPEMVAVARRINAAYRTAYDEAIVTALASLRDASIGYGVGTCAINVNRNIETADGWWQGTNHAFFADHALPVVRIDGADGMPFAILYNYSCQAGVTLGPILPDGSKLSSADLPGAASSYIEHEYPGSVAIFLPGATADQVPICKINYTETDRDGHLRQGSYGEAGYVLLSELGRLLGNAVLETVSRIHAEDSAPSIRAEIVRYRVNCQKRDNDMSRMRPSLSFTFVPDGSRELKVEAVTIGDLAMVGMMPEMDAVNMVSIRESSPFPRNIVTTFINGNEKSMPNRDSYARFQYSAMNSPFVEGTAEESCEVALKLLQKLRG